MSQDQFSISIRLRRVVEETGYVSVPVTGALMADGLDDDGCQHIDSEKLIAEAVKLAGQVANWETDDIQVSIHPIQKAPPGIGQ